MAWSDAARAAALEARRAKRIHKSPKAYQNSLRKEGVTSEAAGNQTQRQHLAYRLKDARAIGLKGRAAYERAFSETAFGLHSVDRILQSKGIKTGNLPKTRQASFSYGESAKRLGVKAAALWLAKKAR